MTRTLILGWSPGNIADAYYDELFDSQTLPYAPRMDELDVTDSADVRSYLAANGPFDRVLYCAAVNGLMWIKDINMSDLRHVYDVNVFAFVSLVGDHIRLFPNHPTRFVTIVSDAAHTPMRGSLMYGSSKAALAAVVKNMARELAPLQTVVGVSPTVVGHTPMTDYIDMAVPVFRGWTTEQARAYEQASIPIGRRVTKDEVVSVIRFAMNGPEALTGSIIEITGGK